jgi:hypothetical protein
MSGQHHNDHDHTEPPSELALRVQALEPLLIEKGLVDTAAIDALIDTYETRVGLRNGVRVMAGLERSSLQKIAVSVCHSGYCRNRLGRPGYQVRHNERGYYVHSQRVF